MNTTNALVPQDTPNNQAVNTNMMMLSTIPNGQQNGQAENTGQMNLAIAGANFSMNGGQQFFQMGQRPLQNSPQL